ncbi:uncharacterized protein K460DRAFT_430884 [Cucurbitaria berberidis CBS 394.84]|uniref:Uncharacterized protein n=1 Tax=Cucurbitaria berberidis CBS 394.84 TaxID=1168544 RepID=A0A9P4GHV2_9PLEO|nr:uncharacterized protein K460DRAFT_430884 [Cucurbitaria berberidis CBS 394.84]KAF1845927.1 hypothetical protein K460DRAFT_430884 [Cucurbitaria berberidis CBS 394.84]
MAAFPPFGMKKHEFDESGSEDVIQSPAAVAVSQRSGPHQFVVKLAKADLVPTHKVIESCLTKRLMQKLPRDLLFVGCDGCTFKAPCITATAYLPRLAQHLTCRGGPITQLVSAIDHIINNASYRLIVPLDKHHILYTTNPPKNSDPAIPTGTAVAHVHLLVGMLAHEWEMEGLLILAHNELVLALDKPDQPNLDQFINMVVDTGVFTEPFGAGARAEDPWFKQILSTLGTYGALNHEIWMTQDE